MKIIYKLLIPVSFMMLLAVTAVSFIGYSNIAKEIDTVMKITTQRTLEDIAFEQKTVGEITKTLKKSLNQNFLRIARSIAVTISSDPRFLEPLELQRLAESVGVDEIHIANTDGILYTGNMPGFFGFDYNSGEQAKPFLKLLKDPEYELAQEPQMRDADNVLFQYIGVSLGRGTGFVQIGVKPEELQNLLEKSNLQNIIENIHYKEGGFAFIIDPESKTCTHHSDEKLVGQDMSSLDFIKRVLELQNGNFTYILEDEELYASFLTTEAGIIVTSVPTSSYYEALTPILTALILTSGISLILLLTITALLIRKILTPLHKVNTSLLNIATGNANLTRRIELRSKDEIGKVAENFNNFIEKLQELIAGIQDVVVQTGIIKDNILDNTETTAVSITGINNSISDVESRLNIMNDKINDNAAAMFQITSNTESFDNIISNQAAMVEESTASITEMIASINNVGGITKLKQKSTTALRDIAEEGKKQIRDTSQNFESVANKVSSIQEMANTINNIASQTNLLSMNAAIEAAHAGESGKGFAVVAEEIRKLAETAGSSAEAISRLIAEITNGIENTSLNMSSTLVTFDAITREVESTVNAFVEIESSVSELTIGGQQIMTSTEEINNVTTEVRSGSSEIHGGIESSNKALLVIKDNASDVSARLDQIFSKASDVTAAMGKLQLITTELDKITTDLSEKFSQFITEADL